MPFKQSKRNIQRIQLESILLSNAKWDTFIPSKIVISFVELSVLYYLWYMQSTRNVTNTWRMPPKELV